MLKKIQQAGESFDKLPSSLHNLVVIRNRDAEEKLQWYFSKLDLADAFLQLDID